ncbi:MAG: FecR family protein [Candidatus Omnitrophota bacterium]|nr:FecR family protein [Candidatus Omnitrophota bacterium]
MVKKVKLSRIVTQTILILILNLGAGVAPPAPLAISPPSAQDQAKSLIDHKAQILTLQGKVTVLRTGKDQWRALTSQDIIYEGDQIKTGPGAHLELYFDDYYLNIARVGPNSLVHFRAIEPTDILIYDGELFNSLDALPPGSTYEVATPTSVVGVRGTQFLRRHNAATGVSSTYVIEGVVQHLIIDRVGKLLDVQQIHAEQFMRVSQTAVDQNLIPEPQTIPKTAFKAVQNQFTQSRSEMTRFSGQENHYTDGKERYHKMIASKSAQKMMAREFDIADDRAVFTGESQDFVLPEPVERLEISTEVAEAIEQSIVEHDFAQRGPTVDRLTAPAMGASLLRKDSDDDK